MSRWHVLFLCVMLSPMSAAPADAAEAGDAVPKEWLHVWYVDWDGTESRDEVRIANLPVLKAAQKPKYTLRLAFPWFAPSCLECWRSGGRRSARMPHRPLVVRKPPDEASPMLRNADRSKRLLRRVVIEARDASGERVTIVLRDVRVNCFTFFSPSIVPRAENWDFFTLEYGFIGVFPEWGRGARLAGLPSRK